VRLRVRVRDQELVSDSTSLEPERDLPAADGANFARTGHNVKCQDHRKPAARRGAANFARTGCNVKCQDTPNFCRTGHNVKHREHGLLDSCPPTRGARTRTHAHARRELLIKREAPLLSPPPPPRRALAMAATFRLLPGPPASTEPRLRPLDLLHYDESTGKAVLSIPPGDGGEYHLLFRKAAEIEGKRSYSPPVRRCLAHINRHERTCSVTDHLYSLSGIELPLDLRPTKRRKRANHKPNDAELPPMQGI